MTHTLSLTCSQCGGQIQLPKGRTQTKYSWRGVAHILLGVK